MLAKYLQQLQIVNMHGDAREESFYATLEGLLRDYAETAGKKAVHITTLPKKTEAGNPDFRVWDGKQHIIGYLEAKAPTVENLDHVESSEQLIRYRQTFPNLILTNFLEFRLYRQGERIQTVQIGSPFVLHTLGTIPPLEHAEQFDKLLEQFFAFAFPQVHTAQTLALELARRTRFLRDEIITAELETSNGQENSLTEFYQAFRTYLISTLSKPEFADLYSQTITYGLFAARTRATNGFQRKLAYDYIPKTIGILRDLFRFISLGDLPPQMEWMLDDISDILALTDVKQLLHQYYHEGKGADPIIHFYETFLAEYDPATRERRGVYYTPEPVVTYIVNSLHHILKNEFGKAAGLADPSVTVLDPAAGTLTFIAEATKVAVQEYAEQWGAGAIGAFIKNQILPNFYAFELMMAPYAVGHLKMAFLLEELGYPLQAQDRFQLYLTNTLEMEELAQIALPGMKSISAESHLANDVKKRQPILVILGNPPYSGQSANTGTWITNSIKAGETLVDGRKDGGYYTIDGQPLNEKNPKWLLNDYVKFLRFAQCKIDQAGQGVVGMITDHSYLDNTTFRGMRRSLMQSFNTLHIYNLHGNSLKKETCPDGSKDENVFDIRQGVSIIFGVKRLGDQTPCQVHYVDLWGDRETSKYATLQTTTIATTPWQLITPQPNFYLFTPQDDRLWQMYQRYPRLTEIFRQNSVGVATARDELALRWSPEDLWTTVLNFAKLDPELARTTYHLGKDARDWKVHLAQRDLLDSGLDREHIIPLFYRPFDQRYTYYTGKSRGFHCMPRGDLMRHLIAAPNLCIVYTRSMTARKPFTHIFCTQHGVIARFYPDASCVPYFSPLYLYPEKNLFNHSQERAHKEPNLHPELFAALAEAYGNPPTPEAIFHYVYAVLYANAYRQKYADFLPNDFPRVPFTNDARLFTELGGYGERLVHLHLLTTPELEPPFAKFQGIGEPRVEYVRYDPDTQRIAINTWHYFENISPAVWDYQIGGYPVCPKWLKDRVGRVLTFDEVKWYCKIVTALAKTLEIQVQLDALFPEVEQQIIPLSYVSQ